MYIERDDMKCRSQIVRASVKVITIIDGTGKCARARKLWPRQAGQDN